MSNLYTPYSVPPGCHDVPFIYLFDGTGLTNGTNVFNQLSVVLDSDSTFILRRIAGASSCAQFFSYRNHSGSYVWQPPYRVVGQQADISVVPEKHYPAGGGTSAIRFDLQAVAKAVALTGGTDFLSYIAFQGVKRFPWDTTLDSCPYTLRGFQYVLNIPKLDWTRGQFRRFTVKIDASGDFELHRINQLDNSVLTPPPSGGGIPVPAVVRVGILNYMLYDPHRWQMMSAPVPDSYICDQIAGIFPGDPSPMPGVFPCPGMLYPRLTQITVDLYAQESAPLGDAIQIIFDGMERVPTSGPVYS